MKELVEDILTTVSFKSAVYFKHGFCGSWGMDVAAGDYAQFHLVANGTCVLTVDKDLISLERGDLVIFPNGHPHQIKSNQDAVCKPGLEIVTDILQDREPFEGDTRTAYLVCGHYEMNREISHPIFQELPDYIILKSSEYGRFDTLNTIIELITEELSQKNPGYKIISLRLAEILFISTIRYYYIHQSDRTSHIFNDPIIYQTVDHIHKEIDKSLNIEVLSRQAGLSRTLFIERFKKAVGDTPLRYIKSWRMTKAKYLLVETNLSLLSVSEEVGYQSLASFNRVFKQTFGITPGQYKRTALGA